MAKQTINIGTTPNDGTGTPLRDAFDICNDNFTEIYGDDFVTNTRLANMTRGTIKVGGASDAPTDLDAKGNAKILIGDGTDLVSVPISGDISIDNTGNVTISDTAVENIMLGDDAVGADELASNAVVTASIQDDAVTAAKIDIFHHSSTLPTNNHILIGNGSTFKNAGLSGDIGIDNTGLTTIQTGAVENSMIGADAVNGDKIADDSINSEHFVDGSIDTAHIGDDQVTPAKINILDDSLAATDGHIMVGDGTDFSNVAVSGDINISNTGATTIQTNAVETSMIADDAVTQDKIANDAIGANQIANNAVTDHKIADDSVRHRNLFQEFNTRDGQFTFSSGSTEKQVSGTIRAIYKMTLPGDGTNVTLRFDDFNMGMTKMVILSTNASTAHTGTISFTIGGDQAGGTGTFVRLSAQDIDQSANKVNYIFFSCVDGAGTAVAFSGTDLDRTFVYSVGLAQ